MSVTPPQPDPLPPMAGAVKAALADRATRHPEQAGDLPWAWLSDPTKLTEWRQRDAQATRIRQALEAGAEPTSLGLVTGGLERILQERGLA